jgi:hypothetical protein
MDIDQEFDLNIENNNINFNPNNQLLYEQKIHSQLKDFHKELKLIVAKKPINPKGKSEAFQFKHKIMDLIKKILMINTIYFVIQIMILIFNYFLNF